MSYDIGPKIGIEGEAEFRRELQSINQGLKTLGSEMSVVTSEFIGNENSVEALTAKNDVLNRTLLSLNEKLAAQQRMLKESAQAYGESDARTQKWQQAVNQTTAELNKAEAQIRQNNEAMASSDSLIGQITNTLTGKLGNALGLSSDQTGQLTSAIGQVSTSLTDKLGNALGLSSGSMQSLTSALGAGGEGMTALLSSSTALVAGIAAIGAAAVKAAKELAELSREAGKQADEILTLSTNYSIAASDLQKFQYMSELVDVSVDTFTGSLSKLIRSMDSARDGTGDAAEAFAALGVCITESDGSLRNSNEVFMETIDALGRMSNATERDAAAMAIFGRSAQDLNGLIAVGSEGLREYAQEAENAGYVMSDKMLASLHEVDDSVQRLDNAVEAFKNTLGAAFAPIEAEWNTLKTDFVEAGTEILLFLGHAQEGWTLLGKESKNAAAEFLGLSDAADEVTLSMENASDSMNTTRQSVSALADEMERAKFEAMSLAEQRDYVFRQAEQYDLGRELRKYDASTGILLSTFATSDQSQAYKKQTMSFEDIYKGTTPTVNVIVRNPTTTDNQIVRSLTPQVEAYTSMRGGTL